MGRVQQAIEDQYAVALERRASSDAGSYTGYLYASGLDKILKKCGEECFEVCIAAKNLDPAETIGELNDVLYHVTVLLCFADVPLSAVMADLNRRCRTENADLDTLSQIIAQRGASEEEGSYTAYLFHEGLDKILKKVGESCAKLLIAGKGEDKNGIAQETGELIYHLLAMLICLDIPLLALADELDRRSAKTGNLKQFHTSDHTT
jgi:phosphoribosyl-ATP pyrophosphohydrolase